MDTHDVRERVLQILDEAEDLEPGAALEMARAALVHAERDAPADFELRIEAHFLAVQCLVDLGEHDAALRECDAILALDPDDPEIGFHRARVLFHAWRLDEAEAALRVFRPGLETLAGALYYRALVADFAGDPVRAEDLFAAAEIQDPGYPRPVRLEAEAVQALLVEAIAELPEEVRNALHGVQVSVMPLPDPAVHAVHGVDPLVLGLYSGTALGEGSVLDPAPGIDRIEIFQRNIERLASDREGLEEELRITLLHEIGHHLGWDEDEVARHGLA